MFQLDLFGAQYVSFVDTRKGLGGKERQRIAIDSSPLSSERDQIAGALEEYELSFAQVSDSELSLHERASAKVC